MELETERLILKSARTSFAEEVLAYYRKNEAFLAPFEGEKGKDFFTLEGQQKILSEEEASCKGETMKRFYIFEKATSELIGVISLSNIVYGCFHSAFLGYKLSFDKCNRGYMKEAVRAISSYAFSILGLHRLEANILPENLASQAVVKGCGFVYEGRSEKYLKINGKWREHLHFALFNDEV